MIAREAFLNLVSGLDRLIYNCARSAKRRFSYYYNDNYLIILLLIILYTYGKHKAYLIFNYCCMRSITTYHVYAIRGRRRYRNKYIFWCPPILAPTNGKLYTSFQIYLLLLIINAIKIILRWRWIDTFGYQIKYFVLQPRTLNWFPNYNKHNQKARTEDSL